MLAKAKTRPSKNSVIKATGRTSQVIDLNSLDRETDSVCYHSKHVKIEGKILLSSNSGQIQKDHK